MTPTVTKIVREYAIESPQTIPVFEKFGIDYCCGGNRPLDEACAAANLNIDQVLQALDAAIAEPARPSDRELRAGSLAELISHIVRTHHSFVRAQVPEIGSLLEKVYTKHGPNHPELQQIRSTFRALGEELTLHLSERGEHPVPLHRAHGRIRPPARARSSTPFRHGRQSCANDGAGAR